MNPMGRGAAVATSLVFAFVPGNAPAQQYPAKLIYDRIAAVTREAGMKPEF